MDGPYLFVGREDNFARVKQRLQDEIEGIVLLFVGERRSGKTSILFQIQAGRLGGKFLPVFVDMQQLAGEQTGDREFLAHLAEKTLEQTQDERLIAGLEYYDFTNGNPTLAFDKVLDDLFQVDPDRQLVILIDEAEILRDKVRNEEFSGAVLTYMASILESRRVSYCFTGSHGLSESDVDEWRRLLGKAAYEEVTFLSRQDTYRLAQEPVANRVTYQEGVVEEIYNLTHGHPFYTQVLCSNVR